MKKSVTIHTVPILICIGLLISIAYCFGVSKAEYPELRTISVSAEHSVNVVPDSVEIQGGMDVTLPTAMEAQSKMAEMTNKITSAMSDIGISSENIKISSVNIGETFDYTDAGRVSLGYKAQSQIKINSEIKNTGAIIAAMTNSGATYISNTSYIVSDKDTKYDEALAVAVTNAKDKATKMLSGLDGKLGKVVNISESIENNYSQYQTKMYSSNESMDMGGQLDVMAGTETIVAKVDIVFEIK